ncbi:MAG TPA: gliding motility-associated C-terminal domain-containing protein [Flavobacteriales bacterium]|nr:gliding motility-associated C-terminal domain-containing protein [Flavobacteriales bacterium]HQW41946.1 gliding motility-associated C-terminal domain-containing protein [Flavobacteriales bacterium]
MLRSTFTRVLLITVFAVGLFRPGAAQTFPFTSGPIPLCDTSTFTASVSGVGYLITPDPWNWGPFLDNVLLNITTDHPQTLQISLTSPEGTTILLSAFNGAGGQNYTNTNFSSWGWNSITTGTAPFTGNFAPQSGSLNDFAGESADGTWTITVIDTACVNGGTGPGGPWVPGWFTGGTGSGAMAFGFSSPPPPCTTDMGTQTAYLCPGETADILGYFVTGWDFGQGVTFNIWASNGNPVPDPSAVSTPGWYNVDGYDWSGCSYWGSFEVVSTPQIALGPDLAVDHCSGAGPLDLSTLFSLAGLQPAWSLDGSPITTATASAATTPGVYELIVQNNGGCGDTALVTLDIVTGPMLGADQSMNICPGGSADLTALYNSNGDTEAWSFGGAVFTTPTMATDAGVYTLVVTNATGCTDTAMVTLDMLAGGVLGADQAIALCSNEVLDLDGLYASGGVGTTWTLMGIPVADPSSVNEAGTYQVVGDWSGCTDTALVTVTVDTAPDLGPDVNVNACDGDAVDLTASFGTTGTTTSWTLAGVAVVDPSAVDVGGTYTLTATNLAGCSDVADLFLTVSPNPTLGADQSVAICDGTTLDLAALYTIGTATANWDLNGVPVADPTAISAAGNYVLTATNASGCSATATVTVTLEVAPALGPDQVASICSGTSLDLSSYYVTNGLPGFWTLAGVPVADPTTVVNMGSYQLVVTNSAGCSDTASVVLTVNPTPSLGADLSFTLCPWQTVDLTTAFPTSGLSAVYMNDGSVVDEPTAVNVAGIYEVSVTDANGCMDTAVATIVNVECLCEADFTEDAHCMQEPVKFVLLADSVIMDARWEFADAVGGSSAIDPLVKFNKEGEVQVTLQATLGCGVVTVERTIRLVDCTKECSVFIPNTFTPNNDQINDDWSWVGACKPEDFSMEVFDRFGEVIFASKDPELSWDGTFGGVSSQPGVYAYRVKYRLPYQETQRVVGSVTLLR